MVPGYVRFIKKKRMCGQPRSNTVNQLLHLINEYMRSIYTRDIYTCRLTWLKLRLKMLKLHKRNGYVEDETVKVLVSKELRTSQSLLGYRSMWQHICLKYKLNVKRLVSFPKYCK